MRGCPVWRRGLPRLCVPCKRQPRWSVTTSLYDVIIVGGGPAGLSAALLLGRCRRRVLLCDAGTPRNAAAHALYGFLTRDGIAPAELLRIGREQLRSYPTVELQQVEVVDAATVAGRFEVVLADGSRRAGRKLLLATGVVDRLPPIEGIAALYGTSVFHCPYCDGWEVRDQPLAVYGRGAHGRSLALELTGWSADLVLCTDGPAELTGADRARLARHGVRVREEPIARLEGTDGRLERIVFATGDVLPRRALFFSSAQRQRSDLAARLGCRLTRSGDVATDGRCRAAGVPGLYVAGDASRGVHLAIVAAGEGAEAAFAINTELLKEDLADA